MKIQKIGVIGAGNMGSGIAQKIAQEGIHVVMVDVDEKFVQNGLNSIKKTLSEAIERKILTEEQTKDILNLVTGTTNKDELKDADIIIEAVFEDLDVKKDLFKYLDSVCKDSTIFASNTSSFSIAELAKVVKRQEKFIGLHFFYHPAKNRLLEIIPGEKTSKNTISLAEVFSKMIGKTGINALDAPGFVVNRFFVPWLNESTRLLEEEVANIPTIDEIAKKVFKIPIGPFELMNLTGVPIAYHSTISLGEKLGDFYKPSNCLRQQFEKKEQWDMSGEIEPSKAAEIEERLLGTVFLVACDIAEESISKIEDIDRGAKIGLRWRSGPFELMNRYGIKRSYEIVTKLVDKYPMMKTPSILKAQYENKKPWSFSYVDLKIVENIARILINRPEAMNSINEEVISQLDEKFTEANSNPKVKGIVLEGAGKAFVAGADIQYFIKKIEQNKIDDIYNFTRYGHSVLNKIDASNKPVIAKLDGLALGGGAEIALSADIIIATDKGSIGFPETGIGIYPGLGGTQRTTRYIGKELAKYLIFTGKILDAKSAASIGLIEHVVTQDEIDRKIIEIITKGKMIKKSIKKEIELPEFFQKVKKYFSDENIEYVLSGKGELNEIGQKISKTISYKAPIAIKLANKIIDEGSSLELKDGLEIELNHLSEIFSTKDAIEGLNSIIKRQRPSFKGE
ncbi:MAG: enoyl-CoA hydratase/isomerase family protein [Thermoplasmatales archaeon]|nr:MAG: enoyl-CoA hydratase/isomerase family protein [Thermoplasmatales archaeon]